MVAQAITLIQLDATSTSFGGVVYEVSLHRGGVHIQAVRQDLDVCPELGSEDRHLYAAVLEEIAGRIEAVRQLLLAPDAPMPNLELGALHLRKVLELIVMGSLVTNRTEIEAIAKSLQRKKVREARELAKAANQHYWPKGTLPFFRTPKTGSIEVRPAPGTLREEEWASVYGHLSELLHARNPFKQPINFATERVWLGQVRDKIMSLLEHHIVTLVDRDYMLIGLMKTDQGTVQVVIAQLAGGQMSLDGASAVSVETTGGG